MVVRWVNPGLSFRKLCYGNVLKNLLDTRVFHRLRRKAVHAMQLDRKHTPCKHQLRSPCPPNALIVRRSSVVTRDV